MILLVTKTGGPKLAGVRFLKMLTDLSLKECVDLYDSIPFGVSIKDDKNLFDEHIKDCNFEWQLLDDAASRRQDKFIEMGMAKSDDVIGRLLLFHQTLGGSGLEHLKEVYGYLSKEELVEIFNKRQKEIKEKFKIL